MDRTLRKAFLPEAPSLLDLISRGFSPQSGQVDLLLIFPATSIATRYGKKNVGKLGGDLLPIGIASVAAYLRERGHGVGVLDSCALQLDDEEVVAVIEERKPKIIGISATTYALAGAYSLATAIRRSFPDQLIVLGGSHANVAGRETIDQYDVFDIVAAGIDGEYTALKIVEGYAESDYCRKAFLANDQLMSSIDGIIYRRSGEIISNQPRLRFADLDELPFPARDLFPLERYIPLPNQYQKLPLANMVVIRGCPYVCTFCDQAGTGARNRSPQKTIDEVRHVVDNYGVKEISFWDDTMSYNKKWMREFCEGLIDSKLDVIWSSFAAVNTVNQEILNLMHQAGCWNIFYGFETGVPSLMRNIDAHKKNTSFEKMKLVSKWTRDAGIEIRGSFMLALPGETPELAKETIKQAIELDPEYAQFSNTTPYPGTRLYTEIMEGKWGTLTTGDFSEFQGWNVVFLPEGYKDRTEVLEMSRKAFRSFYFRPKYIVKRIIAIRSWEDIKRYYKAFIALMGGFAFGPMPEYVRIKTGRTP